MGDTKIDLWEGKYTVVMSEDMKTFKALRYGEEWRNLCGDNLIHALVSRIRELETKPVVRIVAKWTVKPDRMKDFMTLAFVLIAASKQEVGCISYELVQSLDYNNTIAFLESYSSEAAVDYHNSSKHFKDLVPKMLLCSTEMDVGTYT